MTKRRRSCWPRTEEQKARAYARHKARYKRLLAAGSCVVCGAERYPGRTRCTPCGQKNAAYMLARTKRLRERQRHV